MTTAQTKAKEALGKTEYTGTEKTELETLANQDMPSTYEEMVKLANNINKGIAGLTYAPNVAKIKSLLATYTTNVTDKLSTSCSGNVGTNKGEHWSGNSATTYYDKWSSSALDATMTFNEVTLPVGKYALFATGRANTANPGFLSVKVGDNDALTTTLANNNSVGLGVDTDGNPNASYDGTYANNGNGYGWQWSAVEFEVTDATQKVVVSFGASLSNTWFGVSDLKLYAQSVDTKEVLAELDSMKALAKEQLEQTKAYYTGDEYTALSKLVEKDNPTAYDDIVASTNELIAAMTALQTAGMPAYVNAVKKSYAFDVTAKLGDMTKWTGDMVQNAGDQHWSGDASRGYWEQEGGKWSTSSWTTSWKFEDVELPAGKYVLLATGRGSEYTESYMRVITENGLLVSKTYFPTKGDTGLGVDINGYATISTDSTYTNNNNAGRGWEYRACEFELSEATKVSFEIGGSASAAYQWISISDLQLLSDQDIYRDDNKAALQTVCDNANAYLNKMFGKEAFQVESDEIAADVKKATTTAKTDIEGTSATSSEFIKDKANIESAMTALLSTIATQNPALVAPAEDKLFNIVITDNDTYSYNGNAVTFKTNSSVAGGYSMGYNAAPGSPYLQAVSFESAADTDNPNRYYLAFTDASGVKRYVGTGANYSGNNSQLRVVDSKDKAVLVNVELETSRVNQNGVYRLFNVAANAYISANNDADQGFYTAGDNYRKSFSIIAAEKATVEVKVTDAKWATFIAPFEAELPEGVTAYSCSSADTDNNLHLVEAEKLSANTPYILYAENAVTKEISGYGLATAATYTDGALTGTFEKIENVGSNANRYVLQQQTIDGAASVAFFLVKTDDVWCDAYRAYLTMTSANGVTAFTFGGQKVDGIGAAFQGDATEVARYNAAGLRIASPVKGVNIVKYSDGRVVKQIVK